MTFSVTHIRTFALHFRRSVGHFILQEDSCLFLTQVLYIHACLLLKDAAVATSSLSYRQRR